MCEIPNNVIQIDAFAEVFDGFSIGSNDLTQLTLGVDRNSEIVAFDFDERRPGHARDAAHGRRRRQAQSPPYRNLRGEAPADYPEIAGSWRSIGINSISVNPGSVLRTLKVVSEAERTCVATEASPLPKV